MEAGSTPIMMSAKRKKIESIRRVTAEEAIRQVRSGDRILMSTMCAEPQTLVEALVRRAESLENVTIYTMFPLGGCDYATEQMRGHLAVKIFSAGRLRMGLKKGDVEYIPCHFSQIPYLITKGILPVDVIFLQLSPPDREGYCTFGISVEYLREGIEAARLVIAEINDQMPRTHGETSIHLSKLNYVVETSRPLISYPMETIGEVERKIAQWVLDLIPDGGVLQYGPGSVQAAILSSLKGKKDLGIHSGLITDWVVDLVEAGVITGAAKTIDPGKIVVTSMIGTKKLYHFVDDNPTVEVYPGSYTHSVKTLCRIKNFISINSALAVDLYGQVNSETAGSMLVSGVGGQNDFVRGALASEGGRMILALSSTAKGEEVSRIVPNLGKGSVVTIPRSDISYIVTEYGVADLRGKTLSERARTIASIAHPKYREKLVDEAKRI